MPTRIQYWRDQIVRNAATIVASVVVTAVTGALYYKYIAIAAVKFYGTQGPQILGLPNVF
jgi:hypothetical protein